MSEQVKESTMDNAMKTAQEPKARRLFNRNFSLLLTGQVVSNLGTAVHLTAVIWYIMSTVGEDQTGKMVALFSICMLLPMLIGGPLGGVLADRWNRVRIIAGTDLVRGVLFVLLAAATYLNIAPLAFLFGITIAASVVGSLFNPAVDASIPNMVSEKHLMKANSLNGMSRQLTMVIGAAAAGFMYYWVGIAGVFLINGISFFLSGVSEMFIRLPKREKADKETADGEEKPDGIRGYIHEFIDGLRYFRKDTLAVTMIAFAGILNFVFVPIFQVVFPKVMKFDLGLNVQQFGIMESISSVGMILGMLLLSIVTIKNRYKTVMIALFVSVIAFTLFGIPVLPGVAGRMGTIMIFAVFGVLALGVTVSNAFVNMPIMTSMQIRIPDEYRARFFGIMTTFCMAAAPLGTALIGALVDIVPAAMLFFGGGAICLIVCFWMLAKPALKEL
jgi:DHA3 family macrolide efflux protein-like MFS transporter